MPPYVELDASPDLDNPIDAGYVKMVERNALQSERLDLELVDANWTVPSATTTSTALQNPNPGGLHHHGG